MICIHEVIYSVCSRNFCGILSASEDFMTHDEMMSPVSQHIGRCSRTRWLFTYFGLFQPASGRGSNRKHSYV